MINWQKNKTIILYCNYRISAYPNNGFFFRRRRLMTHYIILCVRPDNEMAIIIAWRLWVYILCTIHFWTKYYVFRTKRIILKRLCDRKINADINVLYYAFHSLSLFRVYCSACPQKMSKYISKTPVTTSGSSGGSLQFLWELQRPFFFSSLKWNM